MSIILSSPFPYSKRQSGIYAIVHVASNKMYIGSSQNMAVRTRRHIRELQDRIHQNPKLQRAWNKYGEEAFEVRYLEIVEEVDQLLIREQWYLDNLKPEYNIAKEAIAFGRGMSYGKGKKKSPTHCTNISRALLGKPKSQEHCDALSASHVVMSGKNNPMHGRHHTLEAKESNREAHLGKEPPNKGKKGLQVAWNRGQACPQVAGEKNGMYGKGSSVIALKGHETRRQKRELRLLLAHFWNVGLSN